MIKNMLAAMIAGDARRMTQYVTDKHVLRVSRIHPKDRRNTRESFIVTVGRPNYRERIFIKKAIKAGEPFPIKKIQIEYYK